LRLLIAHAAASIALALTCALQPLPAAAAPRFDAEAATEAWLARISPEQKAKSDAYFEGGYWLLLWDLVANLAVLALLLESRLAMRMRAAAERLTRRRPLQVALFALMYVGLSALILFPMIVYAGFFREHAYGLSNLSFSGWLGEFAIAIGLDAALFVPAAVVIYAIIRRSPQNWPRWGMLLAVLGMTFVDIVTPVFVAPLFNRYQPLPQGPLKEDILSLARANGVPAGDVYEFDASRQTKRVSANVSGLFGTIRISLNDNLLQRVSPAGVRAVMAHEIGHDVLHHQYKHLLSFGLVFAFGIAFLRWALLRALAWRGQRWGLRGPDDVANFPLAVFLFSFWLFLMTPVTNTIIRTAEAEADLYGLNAAREPDGFAEAALLLGEYRKMEPGPVEEFLFFDHPSGRRRIEMAMQWKAEQGGR
jgi:STE24 endopeptidase